MTPQLKFKVNGESIFKFKVDGGASGEKLRLMVKYASTSATSNSSSLTSSLSTTHAAIVAAIVPATPVSERGALESARSCL